MPELMVRPTRKLVSLSYSLSFLLIFIVVFAANNYLPEWWKWSLALSALLLLWPISLDIRQRFTKMTIAGDKLRYESGMLSKTIRTIQLTKVQDVSITQSLGQRLMGTGNLSIETAGETSRLTMESIDQPQAVADEIVNAAHGIVPKRKGERA